jgi:HK97 gp10 family phage protein
MAKCTLNLPDDFAVALSKLADKTDEIIPKVLEAGGGVVLDKVRSNLSGVIGRGTKYDSRSTGQLQASLGLSPPKQKRDGSGWDVKVGFSENRRDGKSNAMLANVLEYGKHGQPPKPFIKPAKSGSKNAAIEAMKRAFESEVDGL